MAAASGLTRAAARRFLLTLLGLGYVGSEGRAFRLTPRVLELGRAYLSSLTLPEVALPHLRDFMAELRESSTVAVLDREQIIYIAHVPANRSLSVSITVGGSDPAAATALGRVLLAAQSDEWLDGYLSEVELTAYTPRTIVDPERLRSELRRIRRQGFAIVDQELEEGLRAVAAPRARRRRPSRRRRQRRAPHEPLADGHAPELPPPAPPRRPQRPSTATLPPPGSFRTTSRASGWAAELVTVGIVAAPAMP